MATTQNTSRYADARAFAQAGSASPFRSLDQDEREVAAAAMIQQRTIELRSLEAALAVATTGPVKKRLRLRIQATKNNMKSWEGYLSGKAENPVTSPAPRAVMTPYVFPNPLKEAK